MLQEQITPNDFVSRGGDEMATTTAEKYARIHVSMQCGHRNLHVKITVKTKWNRKDSTMHQQQPMTDIDQGNYCLLQIFTQKRIACFLLNATARDKICIRSNSSA